MKVKIGKYKENRKVEVEIDDFDTFSLDSTLALIIYPALVAFKKARKKMPGVPMQFFNETDELDKNGNYTEESVDRNEKRFEEALDKMIWSFREIAEDNPGKSQFFLKNGKKWKTKKVDKHASKLVESGREVDREGFEKYQERINEGVRLFGEHFQSLWW